MIHVSIIMATFNKYPLSINAIKFFERQTVNHNSFEVIVIDDGSQDETWQVLSKLETTFPLKIFETGLTDINGMCVAKNIGIKNAEGEIVLFFDDDTFAHPNAIVEHIKFYKQYSHKNAAMGFRAAGEDKYLDTYEVPDQTMFKRKFNPKGDDIVPWGSNVMNNTSFLRKEIIAIGKFDEDFNMYGKRDKELAFRYHKFGGNLRLCLDAVAYHFESSNTKWARDHGGLEGLREFKLAQAKKMKELLDDKMRKSNAR